MLVRVDGVVKEVLTEVIVNYLIMGVGVMEILISAEVKKIGEFLKKDNTVGYQVDLYVDGDRPSVVQAGITESQKKELITAVDKKSKVRLELTFFDGRPNYKYKGLVL